MNSKESLEITKEQHNRAPNPTDVSPEKEEDLPALSSQVDTQVVIQEEPTRQGTVEHTQETFHVAKNMQPISESTQEPVANQTTGNIGLNLQKV